MNSFFNFDDMITPKIITIIYYLALIGVVILALMTIFNGPAGFMVNLVMGLLYLVLGIILVRVYCELMIVAFKINENIKKIADRGA